MDIELVQVLAHHSVVHMKITTDTALILIIQELYFVVAESSAVEGSHLGDTETIHHPMLELELDLVALMGLNLLMAALLEAMALAETIIIQRCNQEMEIGTV